MVQDTYIVNTITRKRDAYFYIFCICSIFAVAFFTVIINVIPIIMGYNIIFFTGLISFFLIVALVTIIRNMSFEYEIEIVNDMISISKIIAKKKRVALTDFKIRDCLYIGHCNNDKFAEAENTVSFTLNCTEDRKYNVNNLNNWFVHVKEDDFEYRIVFQMNEEMYSVFRRYNPRYTEVYIFDKNKEGNNDE